MRRVLVNISLILLSLAVVAAWTPAHAQLGRLKDKVKSKVEQKVDEKTDKEIDDVLDGPDTKAAEPEETPAEPGEESSPAPDATKGGTVAAAKGGTATAEDMTLYTKYDFVPGDKVIFYDDYSVDEVGEFPSRWKLDNGVFEVAKQGNKKFVLCTNQGTIRPKVASGPLPPKYTIEVEFWSNGPEVAGHWFHIYWFNAADEKIGVFHMKDNVNTGLWIMEKDLASKALPSQLAAGLHTMRVMATKTTLKCYIDNERVANVPAVEGFAPVEWRLYLDPWGKENDPMLIGSVRYAEGGKTLKQQLDEAGRIVTHGILFDSGSDRIKAESCKTLADIGALLSDDPALRLSIEGHTDSDGSDTANLTLSQKRAEAVKTYLGATYQIDGGRLETKGLGETKPIDTNDTAEGKANNRRVELVKL